MSKNSGKGIGNRHSEWEPTTYTIFKKLKIWVQIQYKIAFSKRSWDTADLHCKRSNKYGIDWIIAPFSAFIYEKHYKYSSF